MAKLTLQSVKQFNFICQRHPNFMDCEDGIWIHREHSSIRLFQDHYDKDEFSFATLTEGDNDFKVGYHIETEERLKLLFKGLTGENLKKKINERN